MRISESRDTNKSLFHSSCPNHLECARFVSIVSIFIFIVEGTWCGFKYTFTQKQKKKICPLLGIDVLRVVAFTPTSL